MKKNITFIICLTLGTLLLVFVMMMLHSIFYKIKQKEPDIVKAIEKDKDINYLYIDQDDDIDSVIHKMKDKVDGVNYPAFRVFALVDGYAKHIRPGRYEITSDMTTRALYAHLRNHRTSPIKLIVPASRTLKDMASRLGRQLMVDSVDIISALNDTDFIASLGYNNQTLPTLFIPNTYEVYWETSVEKLLKRLNDESIAFWTPERAVKAKNIGLTKNQVMTLASIVDSETAYTPEKPRIAGLYLNRLRKNMLLQSDPTVIFANSDYSIRRVRANHLAVESPYNTYKYLGLPPGPIRVSTIAGIDAVLNYEPSTYIYMCAKEDFSGSHNFASDWPEHQRNARAYQQALNRRGYK